MAKSTTPARDAVLVKYLNEAYGKEMQLQTALKAQIALAQRPTLKKGLQDHLQVTKDQAKGLKARIRELGGKAEVGSDLPGPDIVADAAATAGGLANKALAVAKGPVQALRGTSPADNQLRNVRDCYWNEAEEIAHYAVIEAVAEELGDRDTVRLARRYRKEEERMQALLEREIPKILKEVIKEEVPKEERSAPRRSSASRSSSSSSRSASSSSRSGASAAKKATPARSRSASGGSSSGSRRKPASRKAS